MRDDLWGRIGVRNQSASRIGARDEGTSDLPIRVHATRDEVIAIHCAVVGMPLLHIFDRNCESNVTSPGRTGEVARYRRQVFAQPRLEEMPCQWYE